MSIEFGLSQRDREKIRSVFVSHPEIEKVLIYGSRAMGTYRNNSDIDLALVAPAMSFDKLIKIENELDDLLLPYKIDLSLFHTIENSGLIDHIQRVGVEFRTK